MVLSDTECPKIQVNDYTKTHGVSVRSNELKGKVPDKAALTSDASFKWDYKFRASHTP